MGDRGGSVRRGRPRRGRLVALLEATAGFPRPSRSGRHGQVPRLLPEGRPATLLGPTRQGPRASPLGGLDRSRPMLGHPEAP
ncbi:MAG: hypothetical protein COZ06_04670, partial [Armatimonadetes bacterium CG_4_10_14_3_um_filter_66_18]